MQNNARTRCQSEEKKIYRCASWLVHGKDLTHGKMRVCRVPCQTHTAKFSNLPSIPDARSNQIFVAIFSVKLKIKILKHLPCVTAGQMAKPVR
jgi:hypothetical protein